MTRRVVSPAIAHVLCAGKRARFAFLPVKYAVLVGAWRFDRPPSYLIQSAVCGVQLQAVGRASLRPFPCLSLNNRFLCVVSQRQ